MTDAYYIHERDMGESNVHEKEKASKQHAREDADVSVLVAAISAIDRARINLICRGGRL